jgi:hypothetical protein
MAVLDQPMNVRPMAETVMAVKSVAALTERFFMIWGLS